MKRVPERFSDYTPIEAAALAPGYFGTKERQSPTRNRGKLLAIGTPLALAAQAIFTPSAAAADFKLGFKVIHDLIPAQVGQAVDDESHNPQNGDGIQHTTGGMLVWRKKDNWTAFTDGYRTWVNGPNGLQERLNTERFPWENDGQTPASTPDTKPSTIPNPDAPVINLPNPAPDFGKIKRTSIYVTDNWTGKGIPDGDGAVYPNGTPFVAVFDGTLSTKSLNFDTGINQAGKGGEQVLITYLVSSDGKLTATYITKDGSPLPTKPIVKQGEVISQMGDPMLSAQGNSLVFNLNAGILDIPTSPLMAKIRYG